MASGNIPKTPRWVKIVGLGAVLSIIVFIILHLSGHGFHHH